MKKSTTERGADARAGKAAEVGTAASLAETNAILARIEGLLGRMLGER